MKLVKLFKQNKLRLILLTRYQPFLLPLFLKILIQVTMKKVHILADSRCVDS